MMIHHENYHGGSGGDSAGGAFPNVVLLPSDVSGGAPGDNGGLGGGFVRTVQPYDMTPTVHTVFKSPGAMLGYPFTHAQWKELERQAMIYKYMMASIPVPPELLSPIFTPRDGPPRYPFGNGYSLRYSSNGDPEPGRCKRTDGKKWRCSREVAPDQKYCERHLHRGRPRSRKPVELNPSVSKKTRLLHQSSPLPKTEDPSLLLHKSSQSSHSLESPAKEARNTDWLMKGESSPVPMLDQWPSLMQSKIGSTAESSLNNFNPFLAKEEEHLNLSFNTGYPSGEIHHFSKNQLGLNSYSLPLDKPQSENPKGFIDAWSDSVSTGNNSRCSVSADENASLSSLTLSVGGNNPIGSEMGQAHLGFGVLDSNRNPSKNHSHATSWLGSTSWVSSKTPGGPLAEVLGPGINATLSDPPSPHAGNEDTGSVLTTTVSSPSGVLRRTLASFSDSSGGSSPTPSSSMARSEITFKWFNPNNLASSN